jgi:hypothetical protein
MKKEVKKQKRMTADETIAHVFHPKALEHIKKHVKDLDAEKEKRSKKGDK